MTRKKYTHIFFDLDNTLWDFNENSFHALYSAFHFFSIHKQYASYKKFFDIYSEHNHRLWKGYRNGTVVKKEIMRLRFGKTFDELKISGIDPDEMNAFYLSEMAKQKRLVEGAVELLDFLTTKGYAICLITNGFREVQYKKLEVTGLIKYFTKVFISEDIKSHKPRREIFEYAVKSANARKKASLMVGDDREVDVAGALNFGMDAVWFHPLKERNKEVNRKLAATRSPVCIIHTLADLKNLI